MKKTEKLVKSPIGLIPKWVRERERLNEVRHAIVKYYDAEKEIKQLIKDCGGSLNAL